MYRPGVIVPGVTDGELGHMMPRQSPEDGLKYKCCCREATKKKTEPDSLKTERRRGDNSSISSSPADQASDSASHMNVAVRRFLVSGVLELDRN